MSNNPQSGEIRALLRSVETDMARTSPNRSQIRRSVLAVLDDADYAPSDYEPEVIPVVSLDARRGRLFTSPRGLGLMAVAAALLLTMFVLPVMTGHTLLDATGWAPGPERRLSLDGQDLPALLLPGPQTTDSVAGGLSFNAPEGLVVIAEGDGQLVFAVADEPIGITGQLVIVELELSDWVSEVRALAEAGEVHVKDLRVMVDGRPQTRLDVTVTNETIASRSCSIGEPCLRLTGWPATGPAALWAGAENRIVEIGRTGDSLVLAIETSQRFTGPLSLLAPQVLSTASLSAQ